MTGAPGKPRLICLAVVVFLLMSMCGGLKGTWAQSNIDDTNRHAWSENTGWLNFKSDPGPGDFGALVETECLSGFVWQENIGWIHLGATGATCPYANTSNTDYGVNVVSGVCSGYGWSENAGWINFDPTDGGVAIETGTFPRKFSGWAWGENIGYVHFQNAVPVAYHVAQLCTSDAECDDSNLCTTDTCDTETGLCEHADKDVGTSCDDGIYCNGTDTCDGTGTCEHSGDPCAGGDACNDFCNEGTETCFSPPGTSCDDGEYCTEDETCTDGVCGGGSLRDCSIAGDQCNNGVCNETADQCEASPKADGAGCSDGRYCTSGESCTAGVCGGGTKRDCSAVGDLCNDGVCNEPANQCEAQPKPDGTACEDGEHCTVTDTCVAGVCTTGPARDCSELDDDCNTGVCNETLDKCEKDARPDGTSCDDGLYCTENEACAAGTCQGTEKDCSASGDQCNDGVCDEIKDQCDAVPKPDGTNCDNGLYCTVNDKCLSGNCAAGQDRDCSDTDPCTDDYCAEIQQRCEHETVEPCCGDDEDCDDGDPCTSDHCHESNHRCYWQPNQACSSPNPCGDDPECSFSNVNMAEGEGTPEQIVLVPDTTTVVLQLKIETEAFGSTLDKLVLHFNHFSTDALQAANPIVHLYHDAMDDGQVDPGSQPLTQGVPVDPVTGLAVFENIQFPVSDASVVFLLVTVTLPGTAGTAQATVNLAAMWGGGVWAGLLFLGIPLVWREKKAVRISRGFVCVLMLSAVAGFGLSACSDDDGPVPVPPVPTQWEGTVSLGGDDVSLSGRNPNEKLRVVMTDVTSVPFSLKVE